MSTRDRPNNVPNSAFLDLASLTWKDGPNEWDQHGVQIAGNMQILGAAAPVIHPPPQEFTADEVKATPMLRFFHYAHLPPMLQLHSAPFCALARHIVDTLPPNAERTVALRKLLEGKDAAVRASLG